MNSKTLTSRDFVIKNNQVYVTKNGGVPGMLLIKTEWCGHCQRFKPTFNKLANLVGSGFNCLLIDGDTLSKELTSSMQVSGYPTIKFFDQTGKIIGTYSGDRSEQDILDKICNIFHHCVKYH